MNRTYGVLQHRETGEIRIVNVPHFESHYVDAFHCEEGDFQNEAWSLIMLTDDPRRMYLLHSERLPVPPEIKSILDLNGAEYRNVHGNYKFVSLPAENILVLKRKRGSFKTDLKFKSGHEFQMTITPSENYLELKDEEWHRKTAYYASL